MSDTSLEFLANYGSGRRADGYELVEADYDSIERRLLAYYADNPAVLAPYRRSLARAFSHWALSGGAPTSLQDAPSGAIVTQPTREDR